MMTLWSEMRSSARPAVNAPIATRTASAGAAPLGQGLLVQLEHLAVGSLLRHDLLELRAEALGEARDDVTGQVIALQKF